LDLSDVLEMDFTPAERETFKLVPGDVLLAEASGSPKQVGRAAVWNGAIPGCCFQNTVIRVRPHAVVARYALLVFRHFAESGAFARQALGVGIQHLGAGRLARMPFPLPPIAEQKKIVAEADRRLKELAAAEDALRSGLDRTQEQDQLIIEAAVSGVLVETEGELARRELRAFEPARALLARSGAVAEASLLLALETSQQARASPEGWAMPRVGEVGEVRLGRQRAPAFQRGQHPTPYLRAANITPNGLDLSDVLKMDFTPEERRVYELKAGDVVLAEASGSSAHVGRSAIWANEVPGCCFQNTVIRFRPCATSSEFAWLVFRHMAESGVFARSARGVGIQHLGASRLAELTFPLPPEAEQARIVAAATRRLIASQDQRQTIETSLARFPTIRREVWAAAVGGSLVSQDPNDEPAARLLARLGQPNERGPSRRVGTVEEQVVNINPRRSTRRAQSLKPLRTVLVERSGPITLPELFALAGYDRDSADDIELFYIALRDEIGGELTAKDSDRENTEVELRNAS
jgi:type I restriction enzyme S subunit